MDIDLAARPDDVETRQALVALGHIDMRRGIDMRCSTSKGRCRRSASPIVSDEAVGLKFSAWLDLAQRWAFPVSVYVIMVDVIVWRIQDRLFARGQTPA